jgi:hypothetical protein
MPSKSARVLASLSTAWSASAALRPAAGSTTCHFPPASVPRIRV